MKHIKKFEQIKWEWNEEEIINEFDKSNYELYKYKGHHNVYYLYDIRNHYIYDSRYYTESHNLEKLTEREIKNIQENNLTINFYNKEEDKWGYINYNKLINKKL